MCFLSLLQKWITFVNIDVLFVLISMLLLLMLPLKKRKRVDQTKTTKRATRPLPEVSPILVLLPKLAERGYS